MPRIARRDSTVKQRLVARQDLESAQSVFFARVGHQLRFLPRQAFLQKMKARSSQLGACPGRMHRQSRLSRAFHALQVLRVKLKVPLNPKCARPGRIRERWIQMPQCASHARKDHGRSSGACEMPQNARCVLLAPCAQCSVCSLLAQRTTYRSRISQLQMVDCGKNA